MAEMNAEHINPFLVSATKILKDMCFIDSKIGKPFVTDCQFDNNSVIIVIGVTGEMRGQVLIEMKLEVACDIASKMCMMPVTQMDELSKSAIGELGNMIMGNAATIFSTKGIGIDITPPVLAIGNMSISNLQLKNICIPLIYDGDKQIGVNIALR
jgi:chemotaxis protein CheX